MADIRRRFETLARWGHAARGAVYLMVAWLALRAALFDSSPGDNRSALASIAGDTAGRIALGAIAIGLAAYGAWRALDGLLNKVGTGKKDSVAGAARIVSGIAHLMLAAFAAGVALDGRRGSAGARPQDDSTRDWTATLLQHPLGEAAVIAIGLIVIAVGLAQWAKAYRCDFMHDLGGALATARWVKPAGQAGHAARGVVFVMVGLFVATAGWERDASEAGGMGQALASLQAQPSGPYLLAATAIGLAMFGLFSMVQARCRRVTSPDPSARLSGWRRTIA